MAEGADLAVAEDAVEATRAGPVLTTDRSNRGPASVGRAVEAVPAVAARAEEAYLMKPPRRPPRWVTATVVAARVVAVAAVKEAETAAAQVAGATVVVAGATVVVAAVARAAEAAAVAEAEMAEVDAEAVNAALKSRPSDRRNLGLGPPDLNSAQLTVPIVGSKPCGSRGSRGSRGSGSKICGSRGSGSKICGSRGSGSKICGSRGSRGSGSGICGSRGSRVNRVNHMNHTFSGPQTPP